MGDVKISDREKLAINNAMAALCRAADYIETARDWTQELCNQYDWTIFLSGMDTAAHGICQQIKETYSGVCLAYNIPDLTQKDQE